MSLRILLVEDSATERRLLRNFFEKNLAFATYNIQVIEAADGQ